MKKLMAGLLVTTLAVGAMFGGAPRAAAQDPAADQPVTQAELAKLLVRALGIGHYIAAGAPDADYFKLLAQSGIYPAQEWDASAPVDTAFLARMLVMALRLTDEVEDIDDPQACINVLQEHNIPITSVGKALAQIRGRDRFAETSLNVMGPQVDPIVRREMIAFNTEDEPTGGVDGNFDFHSARVVTRAEVAEVITRLPFMAPTYRAKEKPVSPTDC